jgi:hypothetical protein
MFYEAGDGTLRVAYTDDTPPESADGQCNQLIGIAHYATDERRVVSDVAGDGGQGLGCPYLAFDGTAPYVSFYQKYTSESGVELGAFRLRSLDAGRARRGDRLFELRRRWDAADDLDVLYWGSIHLSEGRLHAVAASWSHPFAEAWLPLIHQ